MNFNLCLVNVVTRNKFKNVRLNCRQHPFKTINNTSSLLPFCFFYTCKENIEAFENRFAEILISNDLCLFS